jgi:chromosome segregation ATPase
MNTDNISKGYAYTSTMTNVRTAVYGTEQQNVSLYSSCANQQEKTKENTTVSSGIDLSFSKEGKTLQKMVRETGVWKEIAQQEQEQINVEEEKVDVKDDQENQAEALIKSLEEKLQRLQEKKKIKKEATNTKKKALRYSYKKVSGSVMRAKTLSQASSALTSAISNLNSLKRKSMTGKYDEDEIEIALKHAKKMVRTAKKKMNHLKYEQKQDQSDDAYVGNKKKEMTQSVTTKKQDNEDVQQQIRLLEDQLESVKKQRSKGNRKDENIDIMNSDMEYLRKKIELLKAGKGDFAIMMGNNGSNAAEGVSNAIAMSADTQIKSQALEASTQGTTDVVSASGAIDIML